MTLIAVLLVPLLKNLSSMCGDTDSAGWGISGAALVAGSSGATTGSRAGTETSTGGVANGSKLSGKFGAFSDSPGVSRAGMATVTKRFAGARNRSGAGPTVLK